MKTLKPASVNRELATLRNIINMAKRWKMFYGENPVSISGLLTENNQRDRVLSFEEEDKLFISSAEHLKPVLTTALNTGMRKGEILSLTWDEVDFKNNVLIIRAANSKSKKTKRIPMNSVLRTMFLELKANTSWFDKKLIGEDDNNYVFRDNLSRPVKDIKTAFKNACRRADIKGLRFHDLRHTAGTRMNESGVGIVAISDILGHSSIELTRKRYIHPGDSLRDAVEKLANNKKTCSKKRSNEIDNSI
jgi:integrase